MIQRFMQDMEPMQTQTQLYFSQDLIYTEEWGKHEYTPAENRLSWRATGRELLITESH